MGDLGLGRGDLRVTLKQARQQLFGWTVHILRADKCPFYPLRTVFLSPSSIIIIFFAKMIYSSLRLFLFITSSK